MHFKQAHNKHSTHLRSVTKDRTNEACDSRKSGMAAIKFWPFLKGGILFSRIKFSLSLMRALVVHR